MELKQKILKDNIKKIIISLVGFLILALGIAFITKLNVGKSIFANVGLSLRDVLKLGKIEVTIGTSLIIVDVILGISSWLLFLSIGVKKSLVGALVVALFIGSAIDFWIWFLRIPDFTDIFPFWVRFLLAMPPIIFLAFGVSLTIAAHIMVGPLDLITLYISKRFNKNFANARHIVLIVFFIIGITFMTITQDYSHISVVTFIYSFTNGPLVQKWLTVSTKIYDFVMDL